MPLNTPSRPDQRRRHPEEYPVPDPKDATTPDAWVKRAPELVRLTGRHPFNVEPPLPMLIAHGHSTPASLHYVRNHGKVPVVYSEATADRVDDGHSSAQNPLKISPAPVVLPRLRMVFYAETRRRRTRPRRRPSGPPSGMPARRVDQCAVVKIDARAD